MDIKQDWKLIRTHFNKCFSSNFHVAIASVDVENNPNVTPIGSLFLNSDRTGFYFEKFPKNLRKNADGNKRICVLAVNSGSWFWLRSLIRVRFNSYPGLKLYGELGVRRKATAIELSRLQRRMKATRWTKGNRYLWGDMEMVREVRFDKVEKIHIGKMTSALK